MWSFEYVQKVKIGQLAENVYEEIFSRYDSRITGYRIDVFEGNYN